MKSVKPHYFFASFLLRRSDSHGVEEEEDAEDEGDEGDEAEEAGEENDRPYNLRQRKTVQRYEAPPIGASPRPFIRSLGVDCSTPGANLPLCSLSEPVNRKQSDPSLFDTHRSPARRSHIRLVLTSSFLNVSSTTSPRERRSSCVFSLVSAESALCDCVTA